MKNEDRVGWEKGEDETTGKEGSDTKSSRKEARMEAWLAVRKDRAGKYDTQAYKLSRQTDMRIDTTHRQIWCFVCRHAWKEAIEGQAPLVVTRLTDRKKNNIESGGHPRSSVSTAVPEIVCHIRHSCRLQCRFAANFCFRTHHM